MENQGSLYEQLDLSILIKSLQGLTLWRPLAIFAVAYFVGAAILAVLSASHSLVLTALGVLLLWAFIGAGYLGAGNNMAAVVRENPLPSVIESFVFGIVRLPSFVALVIIEFLVIFAVVVLEIILAEICRIPVLGGILSLVIFPALFLINTALLLGALVMFALTGPALWFGESISGAFSHLIAVARSRSGAMIFLLLLLAALGALVTILLLGIGGGALAMTSSYFGILGLGVLRGAFGDMFSALQSSGNLYGGIGGTINDRLYVYAGMFVAAMFAAVVVAVPNNVVMLGLAYLYGRSTQEVDREVGNRILAGVKGRMADVTEKARAASEQARQAAAKRVADVRARAADTAPEDAVSAPRQHAKPVFCKGCGAKLLEGDRFCGECGKPIESL